jgi:hypothetical protein
MTITPLSPSPIIASVRRRYLTGTGHAPPTVIVGATFGRQNLDHRIPDHRADRIQGSQNRASLVTQPSSCPEPTNQIK